MSHKIPIRTEVVATAFNGAKGVLTVPEHANTMEIRAETLDVYVALRDTNVNTADDERDSVNLDSSPETKAVLALASSTVPLELAVAGGKRTVRAGAGEVFGTAPRRMRGFLHYKPTGASGNGRLIVNFFQ